MRITGGDSRGRVLATARGLDIRPTSSMVREAVFNILGNDLTGRIVLDLFAGTGCMGIEALSRGGLSAFFVDNSGQSIGLIKKNLAKCGFDSSGFVLKQDILKGIAPDKRLRENPADLVFIDPPYGRDIIPTALRDLLKKDLLSSGAVIVCESLKSDNLPGEMGALRLIDSRIYGETKITIYNKEI